MSLDKLRALRLMDQAMKMGATSLHIRGFSRGMGFRDEQIAHANFPVPIGIPEPFEIFRNLKPRKFHSLAKLFRFRERIEILDAPDGTFGIAVQATPSVNDGIVFRRKRQRPEDGEWSLFPLFYGTGCPEHSLALPTGPALTATRLYHNRIARSPGPMNSREAAVKLGLIRRLAIHGKAQLDAPAQATIVAPRLHVAVAAYESGSGDGFKPFDGYHACSHVCPLSLVQIDIKSICGA
ncbi:MAG: hypothetical protein H3C50_11865 [Kiritimatiellae bacterium]|nr:hypothetical protein [Kiritimatiellia bacterium]